MTLHHPVACRAGYVQSFKNVSCVSLYGHFESDHFCDRKRLLFYKSDHHKSDHFCLKVTTFVTTFLVVTFVEQQTFAQSITHNMSNFSGTSLFKGLFQILRSQYEARYFSALSFFLHTPVHLRSLLRKVSVCFHARLFVLDLYSNINVTFENCHRFLFKY